MKRTRVRAAGFALLAGVSVCQTAIASAIAYTDPANQGVQHFGGNLALDFSVVSPIVVSALGVFNASGNGTITGPIQVVIYDNATSLEVTPVVTFQGNYAPAGLGFDVFQSLGTPVILGPGQYQVDAVGFSASDPNGNLNAGSSGPILNSLGGLLSFTGASYDGSSVLDNPQTCPGCQSAPTPQNAQFDAGTFQFASSIATPEPAASALLALGLAGIAAIRGLRRVR